MSAHATHGAGHAEPRAGAAPLHASHNGSFASNRSTNSAAPRGTAGHPSASLTEGPRVRVVPPPPPFAPSVQAIPSTVTTPTRANAPPLSFHASRNGSFRREGGPHSHAAAAHANDSDGDAEQVTNRSFVAGPTVYVTAERPPHHRRRGLDDNAEDDSGSSPGATSESGHHGHKSHRHHEGSSSTEEAEAPASPNSSAEADAAIMASINRKPAMLGYFGYMFGSAAICAYMGVILKSDKGFSPKLVGILVSLAPVNQILLLPALSFVADRFNCAGRMLSVSAVGSTLMVLFFTMDTGRPMTLLAFVALICFQTPMNALLDKHTLLMFPAKGRTSAWGYVRSFGAYGWGVGNPIAGALVSATGTWTVAAAQYAIGQAALLYCMYATEPYEKVDHATSSSVRFKDVLQVLWRHKRLLIFLFASCMMGMGYSFINNFLFIFLEELGGSTFLMGITLLVTVSTEIPLFQQADRLHAMFTERQMMTWAMGLWTLRVVGYSFLHTPWVVLLLEPLHGVTFALMWLPGVKLISEIFPAKLASSATGVLFTFVSGFGAIIGNVCAGLLYEAVGARWMFRIAALAMMTAFVVYQIIDRYLERQGHELGKPSEEAAAATEVVTMDEQDVRDGGEKDAEVTGPRVSGGGAAASPTASGFSFNKWEENHTKTPQRVV